MLNVTSNLNVFTFTKVKICPLCAVVNVGKVIVIMLCVLARSAIVGGNGNDNVNELVAVGFCHS